MKFYQPLYVDKQGRIDGVSCVICKTREAAMEYGQFVCKRGFTVEVLPIELMETEDPDDEVRN